MVYGKCMFLAIITYQCYCGIMHASTVNPKQIAIVLHAQNRVDSYMQMTQNLAAGIPRGVSMHAPHFTHPKLHQQV